MSIVRPTFSESWYRVADLKARLRASAQISRQFYRGELWYVVRDPAGNQYHRLSAPAYQFVGLLDGHRTVSEAWELVGGQMADDAPTQNEVIQILSQLHSANLIEANVTPDAAVLLNRYKKFQKQRLQNRLMNILFPRIPLWDPDTFLKRWMPFMKHLLGPIGTILWLVVVIYAIVSVAPEWAALKKQAQTATDPGNWIYLGLTFVVIKLIHELGHAFTCRRFGGEVHELGVMFLVLMPAPYVDASSAWAFPSRWHRILVGAGGMIFELFVAAIMAFVWLNTGDDHPTIKAIAYNAMFIASISTVIFNANPLLRYDGYYILSDFLEIPNLRYRSSEYTLGLIKRHLFRVKPQQPLPPPGQRVWLFLYYCCSSVYRMLVGLTIIFVVYSKAPIIGPLMALGGVATWVIVPVVKTTKFLLIDPELHRKRWGAVAWTLGGLAAIILIVTAPRVMTHFETQGIAEPALQAHIYPRQAGFVRQILKHDGDMVKEGDVILVCEDPQLLSEIKQIEAQIRALEAEKLGAFAEPATQARVQHQIEGAQETLTTKQRKASELSVVAPRDGKLSAPQIRTWMNRYIKESDEVGLVYVPGDLRIVACFDQTDAALTFDNRIISPGVVAEAQLAGDLESRPFEPGKIHHATVEARNPTPQYELPHPALGYHGGGPTETDPTDPKGLKLIKPQVQFWLTMNNPTDESGQPDLIPGQRVYLRFEMGTQPLIVNWYRRVRQTIQTYSNSKWM